jgi:hypothetical protein
LSTCTPCRRALRGTFRSLRGLKGFAKAALHIDRTDEGTYQDRLAVCNACQHARPCADTPEEACQCLECSCWVKVKARIENEECPMGLW